MGPVFVHNWVGLGVVPTVKEVVPAVEEVEYIVAGVVGLGAAEAEEPGAMEMVELGAAIVEEHKATTVV